MLRKNSKILFTIILAVFCTIFLSHSAIAGTIPDNNAPEPYEAAQGTFALQGTTPLDQIQATIELFDVGIASGALSGTGPANSATGRATAFGNMLDQAEYLIENGYTDAACNQLLAAYRKVDGKLIPPDFIKGSEAAELASQIWALIEDLNCM
jgi:hypothetical protein